MPDNTIRPPPPDPVPGDLPTALTTVHAADEPTPTTPGPDVRPSAEVLAPPGYAIVRELGRGGMGVVYLAQDTELGRPVALKMILAGGYAGPGEVTRFRREAEAVAKLNHPNVVQVYETGRHDGRQYLTMEYVPGGTLTSYAKDPLPPREAAGLVEQVARGVGFAHANGVVHRDLKPDNILLASGPRERAGSGEHPAGSRRPLADLVPKVTDFGLAKTLDGGDGLTATEAVLGTPSYMAPEQAEGGTKRAGPAADVWALGAVLYRLLTGRPPFTAPTPLETIYQVMAADPPAPSGLVPKLPRDLETICLKCLQKEPAKRYATADALADDLKRYLNGEPIQARPVGSAERAWKWAKRNRGPTISAAVVFLALAAGAGVAAWQAVEANAARAAAVGEATRAGAAERHERDARTEAERQGAAARAAEQKATEREQKERSAREEAERQQRFATAVKDYLKEVLAQASAVGQADRAGAVKKDLTVKEAMDYAAKQLDGRFPDQPLVEAELRHTIGDTYRELGAFPEADRQLGQALALWEKHLGPDHPDTLLAAHDLGRLHESTGQYDKAADLYARALAGREKASGPDHRETLSALVGLGRVYLLKRQPAKAEPYLARAFAGMEKTKGPDHEDTLAAATSLGRVYELQEKYAQAEPLYKRALAGLEKTIGPDHPVTLGAANNLALLYDHTDRYDPAEALYKRALAGQEKALGPDHFHTLISVTNLASLYEKAGRDADAGAMYRRAAGGLEKAVGPDHPVTLSTWNRQAGFFAHRGRPVEAEYWYLKALAGSEKVRGPDHRTTLNVLHGLIELYEKLGRHDRAEPLLRRLLASREKESPAPAIRSRLGATLIGRRNYAEAEPLLLTAFRGLSDPAAAIPPRDRPVRLREAAARLAHLYAATGKPGEAATWRAEAAGHREAAPPPRPAR